MSEKEREALRLIKNGVPFSIIAVLLKMKISDVIALNHSD